MKIIIMKVATAVSIFI